MTTADATTESITQTAQPIGYMLAMKYPEPRGWEADWDMEVHPTVEAAWEEAKRANGEDWAADVERYGLTEANVRDADYVPFALVPVALETRA